MKSDEIDRVQASFAKVVPIAAAAADLFYSRHRDIAPEVGPRFRSGMKEQVRKLMTTLGIVVSGLKSPDTIVPAARALAVKRVGYGVIAEHYAPVGAVLIWTLKQGLGDDHTPEMRAACIVAHTLLSSVMIGEANRKAA